MSTLATAALASLSDTVQLRSPVSGAGQFGAAVSVWSDYDYDYAVVGAPRARNREGGTGRVWYYVKRVEDAAFGAPVELLQPQGEGRLDENGFGVSVAVRDGVIVVGAPGGRFGSWTSMVYVYRQTLSGGSVVRGSAFRYLHALGALRDGGRNLGFDARINSMSQCGQDYCRFQGVNLSDDAPPLESVDVSGRMQSVASPGIIGWAMVGQHIGAEPCEQGGCLAFIGWENGAYTGIADTFEPPNPATPNSAPLYFASVAAHYYFGLASVLSVADGDPNTLDRPGRVLAYGSPKFLPGDDWRKLAAEIPGAGGLPGGVTPSRNFGKRVAVSGDIVLVTDSAAGRGTVYRFQVDRNGVPHNPTDWDFPAYGVLGNSGPTYGEALDVYGDLAVIGEPGADVVYVWPSDNPTTTVTAATDNNVTVTLTKIGSGPDPELFDTECEPFERGLQIGGSVASTCLRVENPPPMLGPATVCFPNPRPGDGDVQIIRCSSRIICQEGEARDFETGLCCDSLGQVPTPAGLPPPDPEHPYFCAETDGFSEFVATNEDQLRDGDSDFVYDLVDNCPNRSNFSQSDSDRDGVGNVCDPTPNGETRAVPGLPAAAAWALGLLLTSSGANALRRRKRSPGTQRSRKENQ